MKKWIRILSFVVCLFLLAGCAETVTDDIEENTFLAATWDGYDKMPFVEFLKTAASDVPSELLGMIIKSTRSTVFEGWDKAEVLDETTVEEGKIPITFSLIIEYTELDNTEEIKEEEILVYTKFDEESRTIEIVGGSSSHDGENSFFSPEETVISLELARNIIQGDSSNIIDVEVTEG